LPTAQGFDAFAQVGVGIEEVQADTRPAGDGPEVDLLALLDQFSDARVRSLDGLLVFVLGGLSQGGDSPVSRRHGLAVRVV
jgi:hypothetical protein